MIEDEDNIPRVVAELMELGQLASDVGIFAEQEDNFYVMVASVHEFGVEITVTPKMRAYLHYRGLHLKEETTVIKIPSRPFMRNGLDVFEEQMDSVVSVAIEKLFDGTLLAAGVYERIGIAASWEIKEAMLAMKEPALHPFTRQHRRLESDQPLVDTGGLMQRVTHMTVARGGEA